MKLYDLPGPPSPRRVRIFLAEKGIDIEIVPVNIREGEHLKAPYQAINSRCTIPALELDNGTVLTESDSILRYLEEKFPENPLFGVTPEERGMVNDWLRISDADGFGAVAETIRNSAERFAGRAITGPRNVEQIPTLADRGAARIGFYFEDLDKQLDGKSFVCGDSFTVADISALIAVDFAKMAGQDIPKKCNNLARWHADVSARPSASA